MIKGMTGFGSTQFSSGAIKGVLEVKSVNHRYLDVSYYLPSGFAAIEHKIRPAISKCISRGRVNVALKIFRKPSQTVSLNKDVVAAYLKSAKSLKRSLGISGEISISDIVALPGVVQTKEVEINAEALWPVLAHALQRTLKSVIGMRQREGRSAHADIAKILSRMSLRIKKIEQQSKSILSERKKKLTGDEFVSFQKSSDINEELTRLKHHIAEAKALIRTSDGVGKKLDFIAQEMQRETNTIGSKLQDKTVGSAVIALKSKIEKIREQSQNIE